MGFAEGEGTSAGQSVPGLNSRPAAVTVDADDLDGGGDSIVVTFTIDRQSAGSSCSTYR